MVKNHNQQKLKRVRCRFKSKKGEFGIPTFKNEWEEDREDRNRGTGAKAF
jgi:hypothetical protein